MIRTTQSQVSNSKAEQDVVLLILLNSYTEMIWLFDKKNITVRFEFFSSINLHHLLYNTVRIKQPFVVY